MTSSAKSILAAALALPEDERRRVGEALLDSVDSNALDLDSEWSTEIANRIKQIESGAVETVPWTEVEARIKKVLGDE